MNRKYPQVCWRGIKFAVTRNNFELKSVFLTQSRLRLTFSHLNMSLYLILSALMPNLVQTTRKYVDEGYMRSGGVCLTSKSQSGQRMTPLSRTLIGHRILSYRPRLELPGSIHKYDGEGYLRSEGVGLTSKSES